MIIYGPSGVRKTNLIKKLVLKSKRPYFELDCSKWSPNFDESIETQIKDLFLKASASSNSIVFLDSLDYLFSGTQNKISTWEEKKYYQLL